MRCKSWRIRGWRPVRCSWPASHVSTSKWHCAEISTGHVWRVRDKERGELMRARVEGAPGYEDFEAKVLAEVETPRDGVKYVLECDHGDWHVIDWQYVTYLTS